MLHRNYDFSFRWAYFGLAYIDQQLASARIKCVLNQTCLEGLHCLKIN